MAPRAGKNKKVKQNTYIELTDASLLLKYILVIFEIQLQKIRTHFNESEWLRIAQKIDKGNLTRNELLIFTDFSENCNLRARKLDNLSQDAHAVLTILVVCCSPIFVTVHQEDRENVWYQITDCGVWYFFGDKYQKAIIMTTFFITTVSKILLRAISANYNVTVGGF